MAEETKPQNGLNDLSSNVMKIGFGLAVIGFAIMAVGVLAMFVWAAVVG